jgi:hypothetical protein
MILQQMILFGITQSHGVFYEANFIYRSTHWKNALDENTARKKLAVK